MSHPYLSVAGLERHFVTGERERLVFASGVNVLVGPPNTGKTEWLKTLDFLLGDLGESPFEAASETGLGNRYDSVAADLVIGGQTVRLDRTWTQPGAKTKVIVDGEVMAAREFQAWLSEQLGIPSVHFPKGNPMSGQTWPALSFRMLLRHIYRQQRFWSGIADQQPESEQHACLLQVLGLGEHVFGKEYGQLIDARREAQRLSARRDQYQETLEHVARDLVGRGASTVVNGESIARAGAAVLAEIKDLEVRRVVVLNQAAATVILPERQNWVAQLSRRRADVVRRLESEEENATSLARRVDTLTLHRDELGQELERMARAADAGRTLANLRITHCPACDQPVEELAVDAGRCFLCHRQLPNAGHNLPQGAVRLQFEEQRVQAEWRELEELLEVLQRRLEQARLNLPETRHALFELDHELEPAKQAIAALTQSEISAIDVALGKAMERKYQLDRLASALQSGDALSERAAQLEREAEDLERKVAETIGQTDFATAAEWLEDGMNEYLAAINALRPGAWRHNPITVDITRYSFSIRVGHRRWNAVLGGTDSLYFLMAYHYGLLTLSPRAQCHYPGLSIIDVPGEFAGEAVEDKENFIVQPFVDLLHARSLDGAQLIMTGAAFSGLKGVHRQQLTRIYTA